MQKFKSTDVKPFQFHDLSVSESTSEVEKFNFRSFDFENTQQKVERQSTIRTERALESKGKFKIDEVVRKSRGLSDQENQDYELKVQAEVERRIQAHYEEAYQAGLEEGKKNGQDQAYAEHRNQLDDELNHLKSQLEQAYQQLDGLILQEKEKTLEFVKRFVKWILIKEMDNKNYLASLLEKLILEMNSRRNLIVKVSRAHFDSMNEMIPQVERNVGQLQNIRVEIVPELQGPGIILETQNGLIDGSQESVMENIEKIFEQVKEHDHN